MARALAADPPVLLMDEPFGAVDPITRQRLQDELLRLQEELRKTIVFVTHDFDEAVKLGDRIAIVARRSKIVQYDTPEEILGNPANDSSRGFVGHGAALKQLTLTRVRDVACTRRRSPTWAAIPRRPSDPRRRSTVSTSSCWTTRIVRSGGCRWTSSRTERAGSVSRDEGLEVVSLASTLIDALDEMLNSSHGVVVVTGRRNVYQGAIRVETIMDAMADLRGAPAREGLVTSAPPAVTTDVPTAGVCQPGRSSAGSCSRWCAWSQSSPRCCT